MRIAFSFCMMVIIFGISGCSTLDKTVENNFPIPRALGQARDAIEANDLDTFKASLSEYSKLTQGKQQSWIPQFIRAADPDRLPFLQAISDAGFKSNASIGGKFSIWEFWYLERAIKSNNPEGIRILLRAGFGPQMLSERHWGLDGGYFCPEKKSMVECALLVGSEATFEVFIDEGLVPDVVIDKRPLLATAIKASKGEAVQFLLSRHANADILAEPNKSAYDLAVDSRIRELLVVHGGFPYLKDWAATMSQFRNSLADDPRVARNIAVAIHKKNVAAGAFLLGEYFSALAERGDSTEGTANQALALFSYREAAEAGSPDGMAKMARFFDDGVIVKRNPDIAETLQRIAMSKGSEIARVALVAKGLVGAPAAPAPASAPLAATATPRSSSGLDTALQILDVAAAVFLGVQTGKAAYTPPAGLSSDFISAMNQQRVAVPAVRANPVASSTCRLSITGRALECSQF